MLNLEPLHDWAKTCDGIPGISVRQHLLSVSFAAEALLHGYPHLCERCDITRNALLFLAASHDVGKLSLDFLQKSPVWLERQNLTEKAQIVKILAESGFSPDCAWVEKTFCIKLDQSASGKE